MKLLEAPRCPFGVEGSVFIEEGKDRFLSPVGTRGLRLGSHLWGQLGWEKGTVARGPLAWPLGRHRTRRTLSSTDYTQGPPWSGLVGAQAEKPGQHPGRSCVWGERQDVLRKALGWECVLSLRNDLGAINFR